MSPSSLQDARQITAPALFGLPLLQFTQSCKLAGLNEAAQRLFDYALPPPIDGYFKHGERRTAGDFLLNGSGAELHELAQQTMQLGWGDKGGIKLGYFVTGADGQRVEDYAEGRVEKGHEHPSEEDVAFSIVFLRPWPSSDDSALDHVKNMTPPISRANSGEVNRAVDPVPRSRIAGQTSSHLPRTYKPIVEFEQIVDSLTGPDGTPKSSSADDFRGLDKSIDSLKELLNNAPVMTFVATPDGKVAWFNSQWYAYTGLTSHDQASQYDVWLSLHLPEELEWMVPLWGQKFASGEDFRFEYRLRRADGVFRWHVCSCRAIKGKDGQVTSYACSIYDVEELVESRLLNAALRRHISAFLGVTKTVLVSIDRNLTISSFEGSARVARSISAPSGVSMEEPIKIGASLTTLWDDPRLLAGVKQILNGEKPRMVLQLDDRYGRHSKFSLVQLLDEADPPVDDDDDGTGPNSRSPSSNGTSENKSKVTGVVLIASDVTSYVKTKMALQESHIEQTRLEASKNAAQEASSLKTSFLQSFSHEIRTPITAVLGICELLRDDQSLAPGHHSLVNKALRSLEILLELVGMVLDVRRIEQNELKIEEEAFELEAVVADARLFSVAATKKDISFVEDIGNYYEAQLLGDRVRLRQVLSNALSNSLKFCHAGGSIVLRLRQEKETEDKVWIMFQIIDTGIGIAPEVLPTLFQPFRQADVSISREYGGSGLGLCISKELAELMGGSVTLESELGKGTTFTARLPFKKASLSRSFDYSSPLDYTGKRLGVDKSAIKILLAEDNDIIRDIVVRTLKKLEFGHVQAVSDGQAAVQAAQKDFYDIILMDKEMPRLDGLSATRQIKNSRGPESRSKIIALTASAVEGDREKCTLAGCDTYLAKPAKAKDLERTIMDLLAGTARAA